jgi:hypothetical protein
MNLQVRTISRKLFENKILKADGQAFADIFTSIMNYAEADFQLIKPWGNIGDRKNDGYIRSKGIFYQVFAPEDIRKSYTEVVKKIKKDFAGLLSHWKDIKEFYFVVNDKFKGVNADCEQAIQDIKTDYSLQKAGILIAKDLENILFKLDDDQIINIVGNAPDPALITRLDYEILGEVIDFIMKLPLPSGKEANIILPNWKEKIKFNNLSDYIANYLNNGCIQIRSLEKYLSNNSDFLADSLRDKMNDIYMHEKLKKDGDDLFWAIVSSASPKALQSFQAAVIVIMSKYFESCDIFKEPQREDI